MKDIVGLAAMIASILFVLIGMPLQIVRNWQLKTTKGLSRAMLFSATVMYVLWTWYGWLSGDRYVFWSRAPGCALGAIIVVQFVYYDALKRNAAK